MYEANLLIYKVCNVFIIKIIVLSKRTKGETRSPKCVSANCTTTQPPYIERTEDFVPCVRNRRKTLFIDTGNICRRQ